MLTRICEGSPACIDQKQYALWAEGIMAASHPVVRNLFSRGIRPTSGLDLSLSKVTYPTPTRLDLSLGISFIDEAKHIVEDNLQRIVDAGLLHPGDDVRERLSEWTRDAISRAMKDPLYIIPQFYYKIARMRDGTHYYDRRYQFMLPLLCGRSEPVLALAIVPRPDTNLAVTVLTRDMAMSHARVLDMVGRFLGKRKTMRAQVKTKLVEEEGKTYVDIAAGV
jgi:hypothetical protein